MTSSHDVRRSEAVHAASIAPQPPAGKALVTPFGTLIGPGVLDHSPTQLRAACRSTSDPCGPFLETCTVTPLPPDEFETGR
jgi:hypothetical protein